MENNDALKLDNLLSFPLYAASREVIKQCRPFLDALGLTYTQYITMLVLWDAGKVSVKDLGKKLYLDSGTLTPVLKSLEAKGLVSRCRSTRDERVLIVDCTAAGLALRDKARALPEKMTGRICLEEDEAATLCSLLYKLLGAARE